MHDLLVVRVVVPQLLAMRIALDSRDFMVWLALSGVSRVVPLAFVVVAIAIALLVVVALGEAIIFLILLISPPCHHVTQLHGSNQAVAPEVVVHLLREEAMLEATNNILIGDVGDGGVRLKEIPCARPQGLVHLLLHLGQVMASACPDHGSLEVVDEGPLEVLPLVDGVWLEAFKPHERCGLQSHWEVESFCRVGSS
jgi:hypothetical protein